VFPCRAAVYLKVPAAGASPRLTVSQQRDRGDGQMTDNALERGTSARARFEPSWLLVRDNPMAAGRMAAGRPRSSRSETRTEVRSTRVSCPYSVSRRGHCCSCATAALGVTGASERVAPRTSPRSFLMRGLTPSVSPSTPSPRSASAGPTIPSAYREKSSSGCSPPGDDAWADAGVALARRLRDGIQANRERVNGISLPEIDLH
jgi:hypothetical protein